MADDLDELLDKIENSLTRHTKIEAKSDSRSLNSPPSDDDLDQIISDICNEDDPVLIKGGLNHSTFVKSIPGQAANFPISRCSSLLLGGSRVSMGLCRQANRSCDKLRCTSCDFHVIWFDNYMWHAQSDYLFFRNSVPDFGRLKKNLVRKKGSRAYACQCSWQSVDDVMDISSEVRLKWVCGKH